MMKDTNHHNHPTKSKGVVGTTHLRLQRPSTHSSYCLLVLFICVNYSTFVKSFTLPSSTITTTCQASRSLQQQQKNQSPTTPTYFERRSVILQATDGKKKRGKRRRKQAPTADDNNPKQQQQQEVEVEMIEMDFDEDDDDFDEEEIDIATIKDVANFSFDGKIDNIDTSKIASGKSSTTSTITDNISVVEPKEDGAIPLPDIKDTLRRKEIEAEMAREEEETQAKKIDRKDRKALLKVNN